MYTIKGLDGKDYGPVDAEQVRRWLAQGRVDARTLVLSEGAEDWRPLGSFPEFPPALSVPPTLRPTPAPASDNVISTIIPYRNARALVAYYLGVFSLIPCAGLFLGIGAIILGVMGLQEAGKHPEAKGKVHAWVGIILGALSLLAHLALIVLNFWFVARRRAGN